MVIDRSELDNIITSKGTPHTERITKVVTFMKEHQAYGYTAQEVTMLKEETGKVISILWNMVYYAEYQKIVSFTTLGR